MSRKVGFSLFLDVRNFVRGSQQAVRSLATFEYVADRARKRFAGPYAEAWMGAGMAAGGALIAGLVSGSIASFTNQRLIAPMLKAASELQRQLAEMYFVAGLDPKTIDTDPIAQAIRAKVREVATSSSADELDVAKGMTELIKNGIDKSVAPSLAKTLVQFMESQFGAIDIKTSASILAKGMQKFNLPGDTEAQKAERLADILTRLTQLTPIAAKDFENIMSSIGAIGAIADTTSTEGILSGMAFLTKAGLSPEQASQNWQSFSENIIKFSSALNEDLKGVMKRGKRIRVGFGELGITNKDLMNSQGDFKDMISILALIEKKSQELGNTSEVTAAKLKAFQFLGLSDKTSFRMLKLFEKAKVVTMVDGQRKVIKGTEAVLHIQKQLEESQGTIKVGAESYRSTWEGTLEIIKGILSTMQTMFGEELQQMWLGGLQKTRQVLEGIAGFLAESPAARQFVASLLIAVSAITTVLSVVLAIVAAILFGVMVVAPAIEALTPAFLGLWGILSGLVAFLGPVGWAVGALVGILGMILGIGAYRALSKNLGGAADFVVKKWEQLKLIVQALIDLWSDDTTSWSLVEKMREMGVLKLVQSIHAVIGRIKVFFKSLWKELKPGIDGIDQAITELVDSLERMWGTSTDGADEFGKTSLKPWKKFGQAVGRLLYGIAFFVEMIFTAVNLIVLMAQGFVDLVTYMNKEFPILSKLILLSLVGILAVSLMIGAVWTIVISSILMLVFFLVLAGGMLMLMFGSIMLLTLALLSLPALFGFAILGGIALLAVFKQEVMGWMAGMDAAFRARGRAWAEELIAGMKEGLFDASLFLTSPLAYAVQQAKLKSGTTAMAGSVGMSSGMPTGPANKTVNADRQVTVNVQNPTIQSDLSDPEAIKELLSTFGKRLAEEVDLSMLLDRL